MFKRALPTTVLYMANENSKNKKQQNSESEILLAQIESLTKSGTWELDLVENNLIWSDGVFQMLDYESQEFEVTFEKGVEVIYPADRERATALMEDVLQNDFKIRVVADITCDIEGSIPSTKQPATIDDPIYDYNPSNDRVEAPFSDEANVTVMAVDNLPCELPRNASADFGKEFVHHILPNLIGEDTDDIIKRASITTEGALTERYGYLQDYVNGN